MKTKAEIREQKKLNRTKMGVSGKSVFKIKQIIENKSNANSSNTRQRNNR